jgi:TolB-like protein/class 3 adenylate cyclase
LTGERVVRRLAAILAADVVGYSRLMGRDESGTLARLKAHRTERLEPVLARHGGRLVKLIGDGALIEFPSAVDALSAATEFQQGMSEANQDQPEDTRIVFRIGLHLGDLIVEGDDLYGDGVNVAARLETEAPPGGIVISGDVYNAVAGRLKAIFQDLGELSLKNIERPVRAFRVQLDGIPAALSKAGPSPNADAPLALPDKPSIAVLPFQNMSGDPEQEYFADGMVEDIITALSRFKSLFVIARNSSFSYKGKSPDIRQVGRELGVRYVLEGSVRKAASRLRVTAQLVDTSNGAHIWADRFDGAVEDVFDLQDQLTEKVVSAIAPRVEQAEMARAKRKPTSNLDAYDCYLRGLAASFPVTQDGLIHALELFCRAIALDRDFAAAYGQASRCYGTRKGFGWFGGSDGEKADALRFASAAAKLGQDDADALANAAFTFAYALDDLHSGRAFVDQALALNPNLAAAWSTSGWIKVWECDPEGALEHLARSMRLSPVGTDATRSATASAHACFHLDRYDEALAWANKALKGDPAMHAALRIAAASAAFLGLDQLATQTRTRLMAIDPSLNISRLKSLMATYSRPEFPAKYAEGLRRAGIPN